MDNICDWISKRLIIKHLALYGNSIEVAQSR